MERFLAKQTSHAAATVCYMLRILKAILADAVAHGKLVESPAATVQPPVRPDRHSEMLILTREQFARLLGVAEAPWKCLYLVAGRCGLRRGEVLGLKWADLNLGERYLDVRRSLGRVRDGDHYVVRADPLKTKKSRRRVGLPADVEQALLAQPAGDDPRNDYVFTRGGKPIDPDVVGRVFTRHLTLAKLPEMPFHSLRTYLRQLRDCGEGRAPKTLQALLGHSSAVMTMDRYAHLMRTSLEDATARLDAYVQGNSKATNTRADAQESLKPDQ